MNGILARLGLVFGLAGLLVLGVVALPSAALAMAPDAGSTEESIAVDLKVGKTKVIKIPGMKRVAVGDPEIADIKANREGELSIIAQKPGTTTVVAWDSSGVRKTYRVTVTK